MTSFQLAWIDAVAKKAAEYRARLRENDDKDAKLAKLKQLADELRPSGVQVHTSTKF